MTVTYKGIKARSGNNTRGIRTYTHVHQFVVSERSEAKEYVIGSDPNLPLIGSVHPEDGTAFCVSLQVDMVTMHADWTVTANYSSEIELNTNPLFEPAVIEWDGEKFEEVALFDNAGNAIINSAGDPFENVMRERTRRIVSITKNVATVPTWIITSEDAVNSAAFTLDGIAVPEGLAKLGAPRLGKWQLRNGVRFREMSMQITLNKDGWALQPLDAGFRYRNGSGELVRAYSEGDGTDTTQPAPLDGSGGLLTNPTPATAVFGDFDVYPAFDFNLLPLT